MKAAAFVAVVYWVDAIRETKLRQGYQKLLNVYVDVFLLLKAA